MAALSAYGLNSGIPYTSCLAKLRYISGIASQIDVLDAERNLLAAELNRSDALRAQRAAIADLFKALGGGWQLGS